MNHPLDFIRLPAWSVFNSIENLQLAIVYLLISYKRCSAYLFNFYHSHMCTAFVIERKQIRYHCPSHHRDQQDTICSVHSDRPKVYPIVDVTITVTILDQHILH
jgi:hypothetical protein